MRKKLSIDSGTLLFLPELSQEFARLKKMCLALNKMGKVGENTRLAAKRCTYHIDQALTTIRETISYAEPKSKGKI